MVTSLYLIGVLPATIPPAALNEIVTVGPCLAICSMARPMAIRPAAIGIIHIGESGQRRRTISAFGAPEISKSVIYAPYAVPVPKESRIKDNGGGHRQHCRCCEEGDARPRCYRHEGPQLHEGDNERINKHIKHRPAADEFNYSEKPHALAPVGRGALRYDDKKVSEDRHLPDWNHHARDEHNEGKNP